MNEHDYFEKEDGKQRVGIVVDDEFNSYIAERVMDKLMLSSIVCGVFFVNEGVEERVKKFKPVFSIELRTVSSDLSVWYSSEEFIISLSRLLAGNLASSLAYKVQNIKPLINNSIPNLIVVERDALNEDIYASVIIATIKQHFYPV